MECGAEVGFTALHSKYGLCHASLRSAIEIQEPTGGRPDRGGELQRGCIRHRPAVTPTFSQLFGCDDVARALLPAASALVPTLGHDTL